LQCVALCCKILQCVAVCCSVSQCVAVCRSVLQCVAVCCSVLQCVVVCCVAVSCSVLQYVSAYCSVLQCVAVCCSVFQRVAVCCSVLQCVSVTKISQRVIHVKTFIWHNRKHLNDIIILTTNLRVWRECFYDQKKSYPLILFDSILETPPVYGASRIGPHRGKDQLRVWFLNEPFLGIPTISFQ